jgi:hypothetical protein
MSPRPKDLVQISSEFLLYTSPDGAVRAQVLFRDETAWLTQKALAELFGVKVPAIAKHLKTSTNLGIWRARQLFPFWKQLPRTARSTNTQGEDPDA